MSGQDRARARFAILTAIRVTGVALAFAGAAVMSGHSGGLPRTSGLVLLVMGVIEVMVVPIILARKWKSRG